MIIHTYKLTKEESELRKKVFDNYFKAVRAYGKNPNPAKAERLKSTKDAFLAYINSEPYAKDFGDRLTNKTERSIKPIKEYLHKKTGIEINHFPFITMTPEDLERHRKRDRTKDRPIRMDELKKMFMTLDEYEKIPDHRLQEAYRKAVAEFLRLVVGLIVIYVNMPFTYFS